MPGAPSAPGIDDHRITSKRNPPVHAFRQLIVTLSTLLLAGIIAASAYIELATNHAYVTTPSMAPTIPPGSLLFIDKEPVYHVGDVIEFRANGLQFAHRIIRINAAGDIGTKGDNPANAPDVFLPPVTSADVIGKVVAAPRWLGFPELILHHPSYGLAWLRTELGLWGKLLVMAVGGALVTIATMLRRRPSPAPVSTRDAEPDSTGTAPLPSVVDLRTPETAPAATPGIR
jgi:signal peptidase I